MSLVTPTPRWLHEPRRNLPHKKPLREVKFRDLNPDYGMDDNNLPLVLEEDIVIRKQVKHLLSTPLGTEEFEPRYGSNLPYRIMDPIGTLTAYLLETDIILALALWMNDRLRVISDGFTIIPNTDEEYYEINLAYVRISDGNPTIYSFTAER